MSNRFDNCPNVRRIVSAAMVEILADSSQSSHDRILDEAVARINQLADVSIASLITGTDVEYDEQWPGYEGPVTPATAKESAAL